MVLCGYFGKDFAEEAKRRSSEIGLKAEDLHVDSLAKLAEMVDLYKVGDNEMGGSDSLSVAAGLDNLFKRLASEYAWLSDISTPPAEGAGEVDDCNPGENFAIDLCHYIRITGDEVKGLTILEDDDASVMQGNGRFCVINTLAALKKQYDLNPQEEYKGVLHDSSIHNALIGALECVLLNLSYDITMERDKHIELDEGSREEERIFDDEPEEETIAGLMRLDAASLRELSDYRMELIVAGERGEYMPLMPEMDR